MEDMWQVGIVVADLDEAERLLTAAFGVAWAERSLDIEVVHEGEPKRVALRIAISQEGPIHVELIEGQEGSPWWPCHGLDHIAFWAVDLAGNAAGVERVGWRRQVSYAGEDGRPVGFTYHGAPTGLRVENVDVARREGMLGWIAGGEPYPGVAS